METIADILGKAICEENNPSDEDNQFVTIEKYKLEDIYDAVRMSINLREETAKIRNKNQSETCYDRTLKRAFGFLKEALENGK